jgi:CheY-like chemotaxis protein
MPAVEGRARATGGGHPSTRTLNLDKMLIDEKGGGGGVILLVEDQDLVRRHAKRLLVRLGYSVLEASNGRDAVDIVTTSTETIRLVLMDLQMPMLSGDLATMEMREVDPELPIAIVSGNIHDPRIAKLVESHGVSTLAKPFSVEQLTKLIGECGRPGPGSESS